VNARVTSLICAALALAACAWFALGARQAVNTSRASSIVSGTSKLSSAQARHALALLDDAGTLNPDQNVDILRAQAYLASGDAPAARRVLGAVTRQERQNVEGWLWLARASGANAALFYDSLRHVRQLEPRLPFRS
jgi:predicted Zn-dependent protease